jgi:hypothetical protein
LALASLSARARRQLPSAPKFSTPEEEKALEQGLTFIAVVGIKVRPSLSLFPIIFSPLL